MAKLFLNGEAEFLNGGGRFVKNMAKIMGENLERGPFGTFKGTILNGGASNIFVCIFILIAIAICLNFLPINCKFESKTLEKNRSYSYFWGYSSHREG